MEYKDYYKIMGLDRNAKPEDIKRAYRKLARKYHPDVSKEANAEERFKEIGEAYAVLSDEQKRAAYDQLGPSWQSGQDFRPPPGWNRQYTEGDFGDFSGQDFSDFFSSLFGQGHQARGHQQRGRTREEYAWRGEDIHSKITITLEEAYHGVTRPIQLQVPELDSGGMMRPKIRTLNVKIPAGVMQGQQIRLPHQGGAGSRPDLNGDLYLEIHFHPHSYFHVHKRDIFLNLPIAPWEAALGATITVPTLSGKVEMKIPANAQTAQKLRIKGKGLPGKPSGDQYVVLQTMVPPATTDAAKQLYQQMAEQLSFNPRAQLET